MSTATLAAPLPREGLALRRSGRAGRLVVEADLAQRPGARVVEQLLQPRPGCLVHLRGGMRVDADGGVDEWRVASGELQRGLGRGQVPSRDEDALDPRRRGPLEHGVEVAVEPGVLEMGVRVDQAGKALRRAPTAQVGTSTSSRGKIGLAVPVVQASGPLPHASSAASPGPPAPRSS